MNVTEALRLAMEEKHRQRALAERERDARIAQVHRRCPELLNTEKQLATLFRDAGRLAAQNPDRAAANQQRVQDQVRRLRDEKRAAMARAGITEVDLSADWSCPQCQDTGRIGHDYCTCVRQLQLTYRYRDSGLNTLLDQSFENYDASIFPETLLPKLNMTQRAYMEHIRGGMEAYAEQFPHNEKKNIIATGLTGLGKTYLLNCVSIRVLRRGFTVLRLSAFQWFDRVRRYHMGTEKDLGELLDVDLLFIDDLGSEPMMENVTIEYLFTVINERVQSGRATLVATNLTLNELQARYAERVFSRLVDKRASIVLRMDGDDVRRGGK